MKRLKSILLAVVAVFLVAANIPVMSASAQSAGSASLSITPKKSYVIDPGGSIKDTLSIRNIDTTSDLNVNLRVIDFTYTDDSGTPKLLLDQNAEPTTWSLKSYLSVPKTATVKASGGKTFDIGISVPKNLGAGSYYSAIIYSTGAPEGGNVGLSASGVTLVFVTVPGQVKESLKLTKFGLYERDARKYQFITGVEPLTLGYTLENSGNITEAPVGSIKLTSMFGQSYTITNVNPSKSLALIGQTRTFTACIKLKTDNPQSESTNAADASTCVSPGLWPGAYNASIDLFYGQNGNYTKEITQNTVFWYLPLWFVVAVVLLVLIVAFAIWRLVVAIKRRTNMPRGRKSSRMMRR